MQELRCEHCHKQIAGRSDKRFCNDDCRNKFNRNKRQEEKKSETHNMPAILNIIKQNYAALKQRTPIKIDWQETMGVKANTINPKFFTSIVQAESTTWYCCFDYCWRRADKDFYEVRRFPDQSEIK